jgi:hypothetical protein
MKKMEMEINVELHAPAVNARERASDTHSIGGWVGLRASLNVVAKRKISTPAGNRTTKYSYLAVHVTKWSRVSKRKGVVHWYSGGAINLFLGSVHFESRPG